MNGQRQIGLSRTIVVTGFAAALAVMLFGMVFLDDHPIRKIEYLDEAHYRSVGRTKSGLQLQIAEGHSLLGLSRWLHSIDIRNRPHELSTNCVGFQTWRYDIS
jgi:hypothetical protein